ILTYAHDYDGAIEQLHSVLSMDPTFARAHFIVAAYAAEGRYDEALADLEEYRKTDDGPFYWAARAAVDGRAGRLKEAREALEKMKESNRTAGVDPLVLCGAARSEMGDLDGFFACMQKACEEDPSLIIAVKAAANDAVRNDPRFRDILRCI